jgi:putative heme iron utilization protein
MADQRAVEAAAPEEIEAEKNLEREHPAQAVRRLLRAERQAVLSTLSAARHGWPFASLAPYALSCEGEPILLLAGLAQHTKNIAVDPRSCLFIQDRAAETDPQAGARATVLGRVRRAEPDEFEDVRARYLARHPQAEKYFAQHDFALYLHTVDEVRFIGGFGIIGWVPGHAVLVDPAEDPLAPHAEEILKHVNTDHGAALGQLCRSRGRRADFAWMVGLDSHGFDVQGPTAGRMRFDFDEPAATPEEVRSRFIAMLRAVK